MTQTTSYSSTFDVSASIDHAFRIAAQPSVWWGEMIEGSSMAKGQRFARNVPGTHYTSFEVTDYEPPTTMTWLVVESGKENEAEEWIGTQVEFAFAANGKGTTVTFIHHGLTPELNCFDTCARGWSHHLDVGLRAHLDGETAEPLTFDTIDDVVAKIHPQHE